MDDESRLTQDDVSSGKKLDIDGLYDAEQPHITNLIHEAARRALERQTPSLQEALQAGTVAVELIVRRFGTPDPSLDVNLLAAAKKGALQEHAPPRWQILLLVSLALAGFMGEVGFGLAFLFYGKDWMPLNWAIAITVSSFFASIAVANAAAWLRPYLPKRIELSPNRPSMLFACAILFVSLSALATFTYLRISDEHDLDNIRFVLLNTLGLAAVATVASAVAKYQLTKRHYVLGKMFICQKWHATERHSRERPAYVDIYRLEIQRLWVDSERGSP